MPELQTYPVGIPTEEEEIVKNCLIYARVSTDRQVREGHSLDDQVSRLMKYAQEKGWRILDVYKDGGKSGCSTSGRPEFTRMLDRCAKDKEVNAVLLEETDRFARNAQDHLAVKSFLKKHKVQLIATQQPNFGDDPVGKFIDLVMAGTNQLQREITGAKTRRTMVALAEKGIQPGPAILGYVNSFQKGVPWQIDKERACFVKEMFKRYQTSNYSIYRLEEELYNEGFRTKQGKKVWANQIHKMLTDVRYAAKTKYAGKVYDGLHDPIVDMKDIVRSGEIMNRHNKGADRTRKHNWFLAGLVHCLSCLNLMTGEAHRKPSGLKFYYYRCLGKKNRGNGCDQPYAPMQKIHDQLEQFIAAIKFDNRFLAGLRMELEEVMRSQGTDVPSRIKMLKDRKKVIEKKMDKLEDEIITELIPKDRLKEKYIPLRDELATVEGQIAKLQRPSANLDQKKIDTIVSFMEKLPVLYQSFTKKQKKLFLRWFVKEIWIKDKKIQKVTYTESFEGLISLEMVRISDAWLPIVDSNWVSIPLLFFP